jgi:hypothetical protein
VDAANRLSLCYCIRCGCILQAVETLVSLCGSAVVPVKKLLLWMEMARQELAEPNGPIPLEAWQKVLRDLSS